MYVFSPVVPLRHLQHSISCPVFINILVGALFLPGQPRSRQSRLRRSACSCRWTQRSWCSQSQESWRKVEVWAIEILYYMFQVMLHSIWTYTLFRHLENHWLYGYQGRKQAWQVKRVQIINLRQIPVSLIYLTLSTQQLTRRVSICSMLSQRSYLKQSHLHLKKHQLLIKGCLPVTSLAAPIVDHLKKTYFLGFEVSFLSLVSGIWLQFLWMKSPPQSCSALPQSDFLHRQAQG